jgi:hypothetical protein
MLASVVSAVVIAGLWFWTSSPHANLSAPSTVSAAQAERLPADASAKAAREDVEVTAAIPDKAPVSPPGKTACANPGALGVSRVVEIDTTGGPGFGFEHFKQLDFLADKEVVLTFDDGPWPGNTPAVLKALADECTKALFFPIGKHASYHPEILKQVAAAGHTIGAHTWSYRAALQERTRERVPLDWAMTQANLGGTLWTLGSRESGTARLEEAAAAYREALQEYTRERVPLDWAIRKTISGLCCGRWARAKAEPCALKRRRPPIAWFCRKERASVYRSIGR